MRKFMITSLAALFLSGCVSPGPTPVVNPVVNVLPEKLQTAISTTCGVVLTANSLASVLQLFNSSFFNSNTTDIIAFAASVCNSLTVQTASGKNAKVYGNFHGRRIEGRRVR